MLYYKGICQLTDMRRSEHDILHELFMYGKHGLVRPLTEDTEVRFCTKCTNFTKTHSSDDEYILISNELDRFLYFMIM